MPPNTRTNIALLVEYHVPKAADRNHTILEANPPANPPKKTVRTSRCASLIFKVAPTIQEYPGRGSTAPARVMT